MNKPWQNNMLDITTHDVYVNEDLDMVNHFIERYGESSYELGRADAIEQVEEWLKKEFIKQNHLGSNFMPSIVINELVFSILEHIKEQRNE